MEQMHHEKIGGGGFCRNLGRKCVNYALRLALMTVVTRCPILRLKCTKFDFGSAPDPAGGAYSAPPDPLAGFKVAYF